MSVCLFIHTVSQHPMQLYRITKLDVNMVHCVSWKSIYFGIKRSNVKVTRHKNGAGNGHSCECWLLLVRFSITGRQWHVRLSSECVSENIQKTTVVVVVVRVCLRLKT